TGPALGPHGQGLPAQAAQMGREEHRTLHDLDRTDVLPLRHHHLHADVVRFRRQHARDAIPVPVGLVHRGPAVPDPGRAHAAHPEDPVHPEHGGPARDAHDRPDHRDRHLSALLRAGKPGGPAAAALGVLPLAAGHAAVLLPARPGHEDPVHPPFRPMVLRSFPCNALSAPAPPCSPPSWPRRARRRPPAAATSSTTAKSATPAPAMSTPGPRSRNTTRSRYPWPRPARPPPCPGWS